MQTKNITASLTSLVVASCTLAALPSCALMRQMMKPADHSVAAPNPIASNQPLFHTASSYLSLAQEKDCTVWPFEDRTTITATAGNICVTTKTNQTDESIAAGANAPSTMKEYMYVYNGAESAQLIVNLSRTSNQKIAQCVVHNKRVNIWTTEYQGCVENKQVLTAQSTKLAFGKLGWNFAAPEATAAK